MPLIYAAKPGVCCSLRDTYAKSAGKFGKERLDASFSYPEDGSAGAPFDRSAGAQAWPCAAVEEFRSRPLRALAVRLPPALAGVVAPLPPAQARVFPHLAIETAIVIGRADVEIDAAAVEIMMMEAVEVAMLEADFGIACRDA